jgi:hypothetical protein
LPSRFGPHLRKVGEECSSNQMRLEFIGNIVPGDSPDPKRITGDTTPELASRPLRIDLRGERKGLRKRHERRLSPAPSPRVCKSLARDLAATTTSHPEVAAQLLRLTGFLGHPARRSLPSPRSRIPGLPPPKRSSIHRRTHGAMSPTPRKWRIAISQISNSPRPIQMDQLVTSGSRSRQTSL